MIRETISVMRDFGRLRQIAGVMVHYGWDDVVKRLGMGISLGRRSKGGDSRASQEVVALPAEVRARLALQDLGPTFVKLGQVLATRADIFSPDWIAEFSKLQDQVPPVPFEDLSPGLEKAFGKSPFEIFRDFQTEPVAAASIAQVHLARLQDGTPVVVKIRRPNIRENIEADLRLMTHFGRLLELEFEEVRRFQPGQIIAQFAKSIRRELDMVSEGRNTERFAKNFINDRNIKFAKIHWDHTSESVLVMERIDGIPGNAIAQAAAAGLDLKLLGERGANAILKMVLIDGFFHADPHPGNIFYLPNNQLGIIDCGMVGRLTVDRRDEIADLLAALVSRDIETLLEILTDWAGDVEMDQDKLNADVDEFIFNYDNASLKQIRFSVMLNDLTTIMRENHLRVPPDLTMLFKALVTLEGFGRQLDPDFQIVRHLTPFVKKVILSRYAPGAIIKRSRRGLHSIVGAVTELPNDISQVLREAARGRLKVNFDLKRLDHFGHQIGHSTNRLTMAIIAAALIVGSSIVMTVKGGPTLFGLPAFGFLGFFLAFIIGLLLMVAAWRSGKD